MTSSSRDDFSISQPRPKHVHLQYVAYNATCLLLHCARIKGGPLELRYVGHASNKLINKKAVLVHKTPREAKAVYPIDCTRKFN